jgi:hypothetical protein
MKSLNGDQKLQTYGLWEIWLTAVQKLYPHACLKLFLFYQIQFQTLILKFKVQL